MAQIAAGDGGRAGAARRRRRRPHRRPHRPPDPREDRGHRRTWSSSASRPAACRSPAGWPPRIAAFERHRRPGRLARHHPLPRRPAPPPGPARWRAPTLPDGGIDGALVVLVDDVLFSGRTVRAALDALPTSAGPARSSSPCWSTAATGSCRSGPTTSARTSRPRATSRSRCCSRRSTASTRSRLHGGGAVIGTCCRPPTSTPPTRHRVLDTADRAGQALAGREVKKLPTLRGRTVVNLFYEDSTRTRISFEVAAKRLSADVINFSAKGSQRLQGREPQGHRADPAGDGRRRGGRPAPGLRRAAPAAPRLGATGTVVNAGDGTHEHPTQALLDAYTHAATGSGRLDGLPGRRSSATSCTAGSPAPTCCLLPPSAPRSPWSRRRRCCRSASTQLARSTVSLRPRRRAARRRRGDDAAGAARADERRVLPDAPASTAAATAWTPADGAAARARDRHAPRADEPRHGDRRRGRRLRRARRSSNRSPTASPSGWPSSTCCSAGAARHDAYLINGRPAVRRGRAGRPPARATA